MPKRSLADIEADLARAHARRDTLQARLRTLTRLHPTPNRVEREDQLAISDELPLVGAEILRLARELKASHPSR
jgi:hypothetical protein